MNQEASFSPDFYMTMVKLDLLFNIFIGLFTAIIFECSFVLFAIYCKGRNISENLLKHGRVLVFFKG